MTKTGKEIIQFFTLPIIFIFFVAYVMYYDELKEFSQLAITMAPALLLISGVALILERGIGEARLRKAKEEFQKNILLTNYDMYFMSFLKYVSPLIVLAVPFLSNILLFDIIDIAQAFIVFFILWWVERRYFHYTYRKNPRGTFMLDDLVTITYYDQMKIDILSFVSALVIIALPVPFGAVSITDIAQALVSFLALYWIRIKYFKFF